MMDNFPCLPHCTRQALHHVFTLHRLALFGFWMLALPFVLLFTACGGKPDKQTPLPRPVRTVVAPYPSRDSIFKQTGEIRPHDEVILGARIDGRLLTRSVEVADHVVTGQVLATQESDIYRNQRDSARADLDSALATEHLAVLNLKRMTQLMPSGAIARAQWDSARSDLQRALSRRRSSEAALKTALEELSRTRLTSPVAGVVTQVSAQPGQVLNAGQTVVTLAIGTARDAVIDVADPQVFSGNSSTVSVSLISDPSVSVSGTLRDISPQADPQTRTWRVRITLNNPSYAMALGASVQVILSGTGSAMMPLPATALTWMNGKPAVFVVDRDQLQLRSVTLGGYSATTILVTDGVEPGDQVVTGGVSKLRAGEKVAVGEADE